MNEQHLREGTSPELRVRLEQNPLRPRPLAKLVIHAFALKFDEWSGRLAKDGRPSIQSTRANGRLTSRRAQTERAGLGWIRPAVVRLEHDGEASGQEQAAASPTRVRCPFCCWNAPRPESGCKR
jgi:hypothetical protein